MKAFHRFSLAIAVGVLLLAPVAMLAQTTGTVEGTVVDQSGAPLPGVSVELSSPNLQGVRTAVTSADGRYRFPSVPPGAYKVTAELTGFGKVQKNATVTLDSTAQVNVQLSISATAEVTVTGEAPLVDVSSTTTGSNYSAKIIDKLPVGRNYADIAFAQPGVQADFGETQGRPVAGRGISIYGSTSSENLFLIDGVNTTNVIKGVPGQGHQQRVHPGSRGEDGRLPGRVRPQHGRRGQRHHQVGWQRVPRRRVRLLQRHRHARGCQDPADGALSRRPATSADSGRRRPQFFNEKDVRQEWGADLGGFVIKDKIWFFGAYDRVKINQNIETVETGPATRNEFPTDSRRTSTRAS